MTLPAELLLNFSWIEKDRVAGSRGPNSTEDLEALRNLVIRAIVRLASESNVSHDEVNNSGLLDHYESVQDWTAPNVPQIARSLRFMIQALCMNLPVVVSCGAGKGRTGTLLACYLATGLLPGEAIKKLIELRPVSAEILDVPGQKEAVLEFGQLLDSGSLVIPQILIDLTEREGNPIGSSLAVWRTTELDQSRGFPGGVTLTADRGAHGAELHLTNDEARRLADQLLTLIERTDE